MDREPGVLKPPRHRRLRARDALLCIGIASLLLLIFKGEAIQRWGDQLSAGPDRSIVLAVGNPAASVDRALPFERAGELATEWISPNPNNPESNSGWENAADTVVGGGGIPAVTPDAFDPVALGEPAAPPLPLHTVLITGDSMSQPLDVHLARLLVPLGINAIRDAHVGTGISKPGFVNWGSLSAQQARDDHPDAVVVFIGANEGFPMPYAGKQVSCCSAPWAAAYADRVRQMLDAYRQGGRGRIYWLLLPAQREASHQAIGRVVNLAVTVGAQAYAAQTRIIDLNPIFNPSGHYQDAITVNGESQIVRDPDGIHLNDAGAQVAANLVLATMRKDFAIR